MNNTAAQNRPFLVFRVITKAGIRFLLKEVVRHPSFPELVWEDSKVDLKLREDGQEIATFEIKGYPLPLKPKHVASIARDFAKQYESAIADKSAEHYVILLLWGRPEEMHVAKRDLSVRIQALYPAIVLDEPSEQRAIKLNGQGDRSLTVTTFRVHAELAKAEAR